MRNTLTLILAFAACLSPLAPAARGQAPTLPRATAHQLQVALEVMQQWLSQHGENGEAWNEFLQTSSLRAALAQGRKVNVEELEQLLQRYQAEVRGIDDPHFVAVREALEAHIAATRDFQTRSELKYQAPQFVQRRPEEWQQRYEQAEGELRQAVAALDAYLRASGPANEARWKELLEWDKLTAELAKEFPSPRTLVEVRENFFGSAAGLGTGPFMRVREALIDFSYAATTLRAPAAGLENSYKALIDSFNEAQLDFSWDDAELPKIANAVYLLSQLWQGDELVRDVKEDFGRPNARLVVSEAMAGAGINDDIDDVSPIRDCLMKTSIRGTAHTQGKFYLNFAPYREGVGLVICVDAHADSASTGTRGKVHVHSTAQTTINASKALYFSEDGVLTDQPAVARCATYSTITGVQHRLGLVRKIAWKKAHQMKSFGENYASRKAEREAEKELDKQTAPLLGKANDAYRDKVNRPLLGLDVFPDWLDISSSSDALAASFRIAASNQLAASTSPPPMPEGYAAAFQLHESLVTNVGDTLIRGYELDHENSVELLEKLEQDVPEELKKDEEWSVKFSKVNSVNAQFRNNRIRVGFRGDYFSHGGRSIDYEMEFFAIYVPQLEADRLVLKRIGDVEARIINSDQGLTVPQITVRTVIASKFDAVFKEEVVLTGQTLPEPYDKAGAILPAVVKADNGWLTVAVNAQNVR